jgi:2-polyprenyl-3-methyl-5-hydroxy-6-metoxy-1,4-benzoquinol methylase
MANDRTSGSNPKSGSTSGSNPRSFNPRSSDEAEIAKRYFGSFTDDYHDAFGGRGRQPLHAVINKLFRRRTFQLRTEIVEGWLKEYGVAGKHVLDLGCGSGEVSLIAARLGARVTGLDIVPGMVEIAAKEAAAAGVGDRATFRVHNLVSDPIEAGDIAMMIGVIEYYGDIETLLPKVCRSVREALIVVDTRGPWWRRRLRYLLARLKRFRLYYHPPDRVASIVAREGFKEKARVTGHSFTALLFRR